MSTGRTEDLNRVEPAPHARATDRPVDITTERARAGHPLHAAAPIWGPELFHFPSSDPTLSDPYYTPFTGMAMSRPLEASQPRLQHPRVTRFRLAERSGGERGCVSMRRIVSILSALAAVFTVGGAAFKW
jgi:hypothetical protein